MTLKLNIYWYDKQSEELSGGKELSGFSEENLWELLRLPDKEVIDGEYEVPDHIIPALAKSYQLDCNLNTY